MGRTVSRPSIFTLRPSANLRFLHPEFLKQIILVHVETHGVKPLHDAELLVEVYVLRLLVCEAAAGLQHPHCREDVRQLVVKHVQDELAVFAEDYVLALLLDRPQCLRPRLARLGGQRVAEEELRYFGVAEVRQRPVHLHAAALAAALHEVQARPLGVDVDLRRPLLLSVGQQAGAALLVRSVIRVLTDWHPEDLGELSPVAYVVVFVYHVTRRLGNHAEVVRLAHEHQVEESVEWRAVGVALLALYQAAHGVHVLALNQAARGPPVAVRVKLEQREAVKLRVEDVSQHLVEPWGGNHLAHPLVLLAVRHDVTNRGRCHVAPPLLYHRREVSVHHHVGVDVQQTRPPRVVDALRRRYRRLPFANAHAPTVRGRNAYHRGGCLRPRPLRNLLLLAFHRSNGVYLPFRIRLRSL